MIGFFLIVTAVVFIYTINVIMGVHSLLCQVIIIEVLVRVTVTLRGQENAENKSNDMGNDNFCVFIHYKTINSYLILFHFAVYLKSI